MEKNKKTFVLHTDLIEQVVDLDRGQAGDLFKMILTYVAEGTIIECPDKMVTWAFKGIKKQIDIDCARYAEKCEETKKLNTYKGIISSIKNHKTLKKDSLQFLADEGYLNKKYLSSVGIDAETVTEVLKTAHTLKILQETNVS